MARRSIDVRSATRISGAFLLVLMFIRPAVDPLGLGVAVGAAMLLLQIVIIGFNRPKGRDAVADIAILGWIGVMFLAGALSEYPAVGILQATKTSVGFAMFAAVGVLLRLGVPRIIFLRILLLSAVVPFSVALLQLATGTGQQQSVELFSDESLSRIYGTFVNANSMALFCITLMFAGVWLFIESKSTMWRLLSAAISTTSLLLILFSYTRSVLGGLAVGGLLFLFKVKPRYAVFGLVAIALVPFLVPSVGARFKDLTTEAPTDPTFTGTANSMAWRVQYWERLSGDVLDAPLTGLGLGSTESRMPEGLQPHNSFLQIALETGLAGVLLLGFWARHVVRRLWKSDDDTYQARMGSLAALSATAAYGVSMITENTLAAVSIAPLMLFVRVALYRTQPRSAATRSEDEPTSASLQTSQTTYPVDNSLRGLDDRVFA